LNAETCEFTQKSFEFEIPYCIFLLFSVLIIIATVVKLE
jgi:hypothetical protein